MKKPEPENLGAHSRRTFLKSLGTVAATAATAQVKSVAAELEKANAEKVIGPGAVPVTLNVNGQKLKLMLEPRVTLLDAYGIIPATPARRKAATARPAALARCSWMTCRFIPAKNSPLNRRIARSRRSKGWPKTASCRKCSSHFLKRTR